MNKEKVKEKVKEKNLQLNNNFPAVNLFANDIINSIHDSIIVLNKNFIIKYINESFLKKNGVKFSEIVNKSIFNILGNKFNTPTLRILIENVLPKNDLIEDFELVLKLENKDQIFLTNCQKLNLKDNKEDFLLLSLKDITKQKKSDKLLIKSLKKRENERIRREKLESIRILAAETAHNLNNSLTSILGNVELIKMKENLDIELLDSVNCIEKSSTKIKNISERLVSFSKDKVIKKKSTDLVKLVQNSTDLLKSIILSEPVIKIDDPICFATVNKNKISEVLDNLIINADEAMNGSGKIKIIISQVTFKEENKFFLESGKYAKISVIDQGSGINKKDRNQIFNPFFTTKRNGNGLGLASCYSIIKDHGGYINFKSKEGFGSTFFFYLKLKPKPIIQKFSKKEYGNHYNGDILVMDDDPFIQDISFKLLTKLGLSVNIAKNGEETIEKYLIALKKNKKYSLVLIDLKIFSGMGGEQAIKELIKIDPFVKAVLVSSYITNEILSNYKEIGFSDILKKPYSLDSLKEIIQKYFPN